MSMHADAKREPSTRLTRRTALATAWTTPLVVAVTVAPAFAASGAAAVSVLSVTATRNPSVVPPGLSQILNLACSLANSNTQATVNLRVQLTVTLPPGVGFPNTPTCPLSTGYTQVGTAQVTPATLTTGGAAVFLFLAAQQLGGTGGAPATKGFSPSIDLKVDSSGTVTVLPLVDGGGTATGGQGAFA